MGKREDAIGQMWGGFLGALASCGWLAMAIFAWQVPWFWWATFNESGWWVLLALLLTFLGVAPLLGSLALGFNGLKKLKLASIPPQFRERFTEFQATEASWSQVNKHHDDHLEKGSKGDKVRQLQEFLNGKGASLGVDGRFGNKTDAAVRRFQTENGLVVDGVVGTQTWDALTMPQESKSAVTASINGLHAQLYNNKELSGVQGMIDEATLVALGLERSMLGLSIGVKGEAARTMQQALLDAGLSFHAGADGNFGPATEEALKQFQEQSGISLGAVIERTDSTIDFDWGGGAPHKGMNQDYFSIRWTGFMKPEHSGTYSIHTVTDDGVRLWVGDELLIDDWNPHPPKENSANVNLQAEGYYPIKMEFFEGGGGAMARLLWTPPGGNKNVIPNWALTLCWRIDQGQIQGWTWQSD